MKNLALILLFVTLLFNCKEEASKNETTKTEAKTSSAKILDLECATFFKQGDYSSLCLTDSKLPEYNVRGCIFNFKTKGDKQEQSIKVQIIRKGSDMLAKMHYDLNKSNYKKGKVSDVPNLGNVAFFDVHGTDLK